jgi:hypothetical protein
MDLPDVDDRRAPEVAAPVSRPSALAALRWWTARQWVVAVAAGVVTAVVIGVPTDVIANPVFGRPVAVTWWAPWALAVTALLGGLVAATYVRPAGFTVADADRPARVASIGGVLGFLAVGCPVCNKLVVVALGTTGAMQWFAPIQPVLAVASVVVLAVAARTRLRNQQSCPVGR